MIALLSRYQIGQQVRTDGPQTHLQKSGTPTMGGGLILVAMLLGTLLWADLSSRFIWILLATTLCFGLIGFYDDYLKLVVGNSKGLAARYKYLAQSVLGLKLETIYRGIIPFVIIYLIALALITYIPEISLIGVRMLLAKG